MSAAKQKTGERRKPASKGTWADTMKAALARKQPAGGWPTQPKPRDPGTKKVKKNAF